MRTAVMPMPKWPLVGRSAEVGRVAELLQDGAGGVVLVGPAGVGKTRLAGECLALAADRGFVPIRVAATQAAASLPFGAYAPLLPDLAPGVDRAGVLRQVSRAIVNRGEGKRVAVFVDDVHLLDDGSAALTRHLTADDGTFVLATVRSGEPASDAVVALWKDGLAERLEVSSLSPADVEELLGAVLGGPADRATVQSLWERSEGNALFLKELVLGATEGGVLRDDDGVWRLLGELPATARLIELVEARLVGLDDEDRRALDVLALRGSMELDSFEQVAGNARLAALERAGLIRVEADRRRTNMKLSHPLYGEVIRARLSPLRTRALYRAMADTGFPVADHGVGRHGDDPRAFPRRLALPNAAGGFDPVHLGSMETSMSITSQWWRSGAASASTPLLATSPR